MTEQFDVEVTPVGQDSDGRTINSVVLENDVMRVELLDIGATLWRLQLKRFDNRLVTLGHGDPMQYLDNPSYLGCTVGPVANRISASTFALNGRRHELDANEGPNHLHGGPTGFGRVPWDVSIDNGSTVTFTHTRPDGEGGYPGHLEVEVSWTLDEEALIFAWKAVADESTPVSLTNHTYWNLAGAGTIHEHELTVDARELVEIDDELLPTGRLVPVDELDFRVARRIGDVLDSDPGGVDHCYVLDGSSPTSLRLPEDDLRLEVVTSLPGIQVYTSHMLDGSDAHGGHPPYSGICLETQHLPDAVNHLAFPSPLVEPETTVTHSTIYRFVS